MVISTYVFISFCSFAPLLLDPAGGLLFPVPPPFCPPPKQISGYALARNPPKPGSRCSVFWTYGFRLLNFCDLQPEPCMLLQEMSYNC